MWKQQSYAFLGGMRAMILAAGLGSRLGELTRETPKCLIEVNQVPMLRRVCENLAKAGVDRIIINLHYHAEQVQDYASRNLGDLFKEIKFSFEPKLLGTGGGLKATKTFFENEPNLLMVNADIYTAYPLKDLVKRLEASKKLLGCLAVMKRAESSYLKFDREQNFRGWLKADQVALESEHRATSTDNIFAFCGLQALSSKIFDYLDAQTQEDFSIIETYMLAQAAGEQITFCDISSQPWFDMGTPDQLQLLRAHLS